MNSDYRKRITLNDNSFAVEDLKSQSERVIGILISCTGEKYHPRLFKLRNDIKNNSQIEILKNGTDKEYWHKLLFINNNPNWFDDSHHGLVISYFHRLLLEKIGYFETGSDPYHSIKCHLFNQSITKIKFTENINEIIYGMLWGNKVDLVPSFIGEGKLLILDDSNKIINYLDQKNIKRIDILADNFGEEFLYDLKFVDYLISKKEVAVVNYHVKNYPYNITDTTFQDAIWAIDQLIKSYIKPFQLLGIRINEFITKGKLKFTTYPFTTLGMDRSSALSVIKKQYQGSSLIITKGDFNYRKDVGWFYWEVEDSYEEIVAYLNAPIASFRVIKNEVHVGISDNTTLKYLNDNHPNWWKSGIAGMIKYSAPDNFLCNSTNPINPHLDNFWADSIAGV